MPKLQTTAGQLLVNELLPADMRDFGRVLDKKGVAALMRELGEKHPDKYREVSHKLGQLGWQAAYRTGGNSFGLASMLRAQSAIKRHATLNRELSQILENDNLSDDDRDKLIISTVGAHSTPQEQEILAESLAEKNPLALQLKGAGRGNAMNLASLRGGDLLYNDHHGRVIPIPVTKSYSEGLDPAAYWANTYGARKGVFDTKFATQEAGALSKQLNQINHRLLITGQGELPEGLTLRGLPVDIDDDESEGSLLAHPAAGYPRNTVLSSKILHDMKKKGVTRLLVRSPAVSGAPDGGVYAADVGIRERMGLPTVGENVGLAAAQALSEPLNQAQLSSKHSGGVASANVGNAVSGFDAINQLVQVPKTFKGGAAHAENDGQVQFIEPAPAGGNYVHIDGAKHYVGEGYKISVKPGDKVEAGDVISDGIPNPAVIVRHKGIGEGRRYFIDAFRNAFRNAGIRGNRRNIELLSRGLINHIRLTDETAGGVPDDVLPYSVFEHQYEPREGFKTTTPAGGVNKYLERPYLHYTIGTKIRPSMLKEFKQFGVESVDVHEDAPPFEPEMIRGMQNLAHDPDWMTRMLGSNLKGSLLKGVHRGATSDATGTSYVPSIAKAVDFGDLGAVQTPKQVTPMKPGDVLKAPAPMKPHDILKPRGVLL